MSLKAHYKVFERWQKTCHALHLSLVLTGMDVLYEPLKNGCVAKTHGEIRWT